MSKETPNYSAWQIQRALNLRYPLEKGWVPASEVANDRANRFADHVAIYCWPPPCVVGHEIKVTRADFLRELQDPTKREWIEKTCHRRWFVAPKGLIEPAEIPAGWGLMEVLGKRDDPKLRSKLAAPIMDVECDVPTWFGRVLWKKVSLQEAAEKQAFKLKEKMAAGGYGEREKELEKKEHELYGKQHQVERDLEELENYWRKLTSAAGVKLGWREKAPRMDVHALLTAMRQEAAKDVMEMAQRASRACAELAELAEQAFENTKQNEEGESSC